MPDYPKSFFTSPFCNSGDKALIQETASAEGRATLPAGFPIETSTPLKNGGIAPNRLDFNGILYMLSALEFWQQSGGMMQYLKTLNYTPPAIIYSNGQYWQCIKENGPASAVAAPGEDESCWIPLNEYMLNTYGITLTGDATGVSVTTSSGLKIEVTNTQAQKWTTARTLSLSGDASGSVSIDGSQDVTLPVSAMQAGKWATPRALTLSGDASGSVTMDGSANVTLAVTNTQAAKWKTARRLSLTGAVTGSASINGASDVSITTNMGSSSNMVPNWNGWLFSNDVTYTASTNGYITCEWQLNEGSHCGRVSCTVAGITYGWYNSAYGSGSCGFQCIGTLPVKKGNTYRVSRASYARFIPADG